MGKRDMANQVPMYRAWLHAVGGRVRVPSNERDYGAVNSKAAACLHVRYHYKDTRAEDWPLVVRVLCPSGEVHDVTVKRVVEYDYQPAMVEQISGPR